MTMKPVFTPGPWRFGHYGDGERFWIGPDYDRPVVADVPRAFEANARLIAAAPELFEALQALLEPVPGRNAHEAIRARAAAEERARTVLAKAKGSPTIDYGGSRLPSPTQRRSSAGDDKGSSLPSLFGARLSGERAGLRRTAALPATRRAARPQSVATETTG